MVPRVLYQKFAGIWTPMHPVWTALPLAYAPLGFAAMRYGLAAAWWS